MVCFLGALIFLGTFCNLLHFSFVLLVREKNREESNEGMRLSIQELVDEYKDNIYAVAFNVCKNAQDAEDVVQDTFISYYTEKKEFENRQHIRAWLIRVAINKAKNVNRTFWRRNVLSLKDYIGTLEFDTSESEELFSAVMKLPGKYRIVIHLFYYEDYSVNEIADILNISVSNVKVRLSRGRSMLRECLKEEWEDE